MRAVLVTAALLVLGCSKREPPMQTITTPATAPTASAAPAAPVSTILSRAFFTVDANLVVCLDLDAKATIDSGAWTAQQRQDALKKYEANDAGAGAFTASGPLKGGSSTVIQDDCSTAFRDRLQLASCANGPALMHYYSFALLETDVEMRDCLQGHGSWSALPRDSDEYRRAHARYEIEKAQRASEKLQQQLGH